MFRVAFSLFVFFVLTLGTRAFAADYFTYFDSAGKLVISNKQPPPGSKIIKKQDLPDVTDEESQKAEESKDPRAEQQPKENAK